MSTHSPQPTDQPFATKKYLDVAGHRMAYIDEGEGPAIVFQHGNPASSYLWRNIMPAVRNLGRVVAADFMGMGDSEKLDPQMGKARYSFLEQRKYLHGLWDALDLGNDVILVLHDVGSMFGFDWANQHRDRIQGIAYMESIVMPLVTTDFPPHVQKVLGNYSSEEGRERNLHNLDFLDRFLLGEREFNEVEQAYYRKPFLVPGEDRRPMFWFEFPIDGQPEHTASIVEAYSRWLATSDLPKLLIRAEPGYLIRNRLLEFARTWPNQTEVTVPGIHFVQETSPAEVGEALATFVRCLRPTLRA